MIKLMTPFDWLFCIMVVGLYAGSTIFLIHGNLGLSAYWFFTGILNSWLIGSYLYRKSGSEKNE